MVIVIVITSMMLFVFGDVTKENETRSQIVRCSNYAMGFPFIYPRYR